ncbi:MAG: primosomal protein N' [Cellulomonas sp.]|nr:primosomal protein N' [Cellulomonas sp.]
MCPVTDAVQPTLAGMPRTRSRRPAPPVEAAAELPVARVCVDVQPAHLDRVFEYLVPAALDEVAVPGVRVKVRFAGKDVDGWLLDRTASAEHDGRLLPLRRVVSAEPVLTPPVARLARAVADRYAGTLADVLRLAVPPRHARVEAETAPQTGDGTASTGDDGPAVDPVDPTGSRPADSASVAAAATPWHRYRGGEALRRHLRDGGGPRAVWTALPGCPGLDWPDALADAVVATASAGRGALVVLPDARDVARVADALTAAGVPPHRPRGAGGFVTLTADLGPAARYRAFLAVRRGAARVVVGTRAAAFAPVADLGLAVCWDDGDDLHAEQRAPYPHVREVLALRSELEGCALVIGGLGRTVHAQALVARGWARAVEADRATVRSATGRVRALTSVELADQGPAAAARLPAPAWRAVRDGLVDGPVLVQVPRAGYVPVVACARCRAPAACPHCAGPLGLPARGGPPACTWCGRLVPDLQCAVCGSTGLRAVRVGSDRTAEELGRAFPGATVRVSGARADGGVLDRVPATPAVVVATPGAEPVADGGYAATLLLDAPVAAGLRTETESLRRWLAAAALTRPGGPVLLVGDGPARASQALVRWDPVWLADTDLVERTELGLPPAVRAAAATGSRGAVEAFAGRVDVPGLLVLGPVPVAEDEVRVVLRAPLRHGPALAAAVAGALGVRSTRREPGALRVRMDPPDLA